MRRAKKELRDAADTGAGFSEPKSKLGGRIFLFLFGIPFFGAGLGFFIFGGFLPVFKSLASQSWPGVPCTIESSYVHRNADSDGDTFKPVITFSYEFEGRSYSGGSYNFSDWSSSGRKGKQEIVDRYPVGSQASCRVKPGDPSVAVLSRAVPASVFFVVPFSALFMLVGGGVMLGATGLLPGKWSPASGHKPVETLEKGRTRLKPEAGGPAGKLVAALLFCGFWNGIVGVFLWQVIKGFMEGDPTWFLVVFLIPFVFVGLGLIGLVLHQFLALFNPKPQVWLDEGSPRLGDRVTLRWQFSGKVNRIKKLTISLKGWEAATYRRGTDSVTDHSLFYTEDIVAAEGPANRTLMDAEFTVPAALMHSFTSSNNKIVWKIELNGEVRRWPDLSEAYKITVRSLKPQAHHGAVIAD